MVKGLKAEKLRSSFHALRRLIFHLFLSVSNRKDVTKILIPQTFFRRGCQIHRNSEQQVGRGDNPPHMNNHF